MEIYEFDDYRTFLRLKYDHLKKSSRKYSMGMIARKVGCSESFLKKLFTNKTQLGLKHAEPLLKVLKVSEAETQYVYFWLLYEQTTDVTLRQYFKHILYSLAQRMKVELPIFTRELEDQTLQAELNSVDLGIHVALELSRILKRPATAAEITTRLKPSLTKFIDAKTISHAARTAAERIAKQEQATGLPFHQSTFMPSSEIAFDAIKAHIPVAILHSKAIPQITDFGPFTIGTSISAVDRDSANEILGILREAREKIFAIQAQQTAPTMLLSVQLQALSLMPP